jgi:hypothetical protein
LGRFLYVQNSLKLALTTRIIRTSAATMNRSTNGPFWNGYAGAAFNNKGGLRTFAASANLMGLYCGN